MKSLRIKLEVKQDSNPNMVPNHPSAQTNNEVAMTLEVEEEVEEVVEVVAIVVAEVAWIEVAEEVIEVAAEVEAVEVDHLVEVDREQNHLVKNVLIQWDTLVNQRVVTANHQVEERDRKVVITEKEVKEEKVVVDDTMKKYYDF